MIEKGHSHIILTLLNGPMGLYMTFKVFLSGGFMVILLKNHKSLDGEYNGEVSTYEFNNDSFHNSKRSGPAIVKDLQNERPHEGYSAVWVTEIMPFSYRILVTALMSIYVFEITSSYFHHRNVISSETFHSQPI